MDSCSPFPSSIYHTSTRHIPPPTHPLSLFSQHTLLPTMKISSMTKYIQPLVLLVFVIQPITGISSGFIADELASSVTTNSSLVLVPVEPIQYHILEANSITNRRRLAPFQLCLLCKCCASGGNPNSTCATMPCCFGIDCQLPNKPFGVCAFVPKTCNCTSCAE
ncbi:hypothetical protein IFM89_013517 [Coptis chinensis]|uniref:DUF7866 domain-containing protein n=1 Tax=Coptis chinensis TaxID=261450 RepID=A0A835H301_9MAGN|nr:hypothetical protein IFM89_013517 [Coptis chinensis]